MVSGPEAADTEGLRHAYLAYGGELLGYARRSLGEPQLAEEAVQETFARAWRFRESFNRDLGAFGDGSSPSSAESSLTWLSNDPPVLPSRSSWNRPPLRMRSSGP